MKKAKKILKIIGIVLGVLILLVALALLLVSPIAKAYVEKHDKELVGREITIDKLRVNVLAGKVKIQGLTLYEDDAQHAFVQLGNFETSLKLRDLLHRQITVEKLWLLGLKVNIEQNRTWFNFNSLIDHFASDEPKEEKTEKSDFGVTLYDILIDSSFIRYADVAVGSEFLLNDIELKVPKIDLSTLKSQVGLDLVLGKDANLHTQLHLSENAEDYILKMQLDNLDLNIIEPYLKQSLAVDSVCGKLDFNLQALGRTEHILDFDLTGDIALRDIAVQDNSGYLIGTIDSINTDIQKFSIKENYLNLKRLKLSGIHTEYIVKADNSTNFDIILGKQKQYSDTTIFEKIGDTIAAEFNEVQENKALKIFVQNLQLANSRVYYEDNTLPSPFQYEITDINLSSKNFNFNGENNVQMRALLNQVGKLNVVWKGHVTSLDNHNLTLLLNNLKLSDFSPYSIQFFGYPLENGTLSFNSQNIITDRNLKGINKLEIAEPKAGDKLKDYEPEIKHVPLKLGLYLLTDKENKLKVDLPVAGSLDDPEFSYKRALLKVLGGLIVKVCTAPFRLLSGDDEVQYIEYDQLHFDFTALEYSQIDEVASTMQEKPELILVLQQRINYHDAVQSLCNIQLQRDYYRSTHPELQTTGMDFLTNEEIRSIKLNDKGLMEYASQFAEEGKTVQSKQEVETIALKLFGDKSDELLTRMIERKNSKLMSYLTTTKGVQASRITINVPTLEAMKDYDKACRYEIHAGFGDEKFE
jgi:hypothetical protein